jgi:hypothetical protein
MALFQQHKACVTPNEPGPAGDEHAPTHLFERFDEADSECINFIGKV